MLIKGFDMLKIIKEVTLGDTNLNLTFHEACSLCFQRVQENFEMGQQAGFIYRIKNRKQRRE